MLSYIDHLPLPGEGSNSNILQKDLTIPKIHYAYEQSKRLLELFQQTFLLEESFGEGIFTRIENFSYVNPKLCLEIVLLEEIIILCDNYRKRISSREEALKYVIEVRRWNSLVDKTLTLHIQSCEEYQEILHTTLMYVIYHTYISCSLLKPLQFSSLIYISDES